MTEAINTLLVIGTAAALTTAVLTLANVVSVVNNSTNENWSPFECGFTEMSNQRVPFSTQFFIIAILFLIFDVEISLLMPYPTSNTNPTNTCSIIIILLILFLGLVYEWNANNISWSH